MIDSNEIFIQDFSNKNKQQRKWYSSFSQDMQKYISKTLDSVWTWLKRLTVQAQVFEVAVGEVVLHDGHERGHLTEEQHFVVGGAELWQDAVQQLKLTGGPVQIKSTKSRYSTQ